MERSSGWQLWWSLGTLKESFNVSTEYQGSHPNDHSFSVYTTQTKLNQALTESLYFVDVPSIVVYHCSLTFTISIFPFRPIKYDLIISRRSSAVEVLIIVLHIRGIHHRLIHFLFLSVLSIPRPNNLPHRPSSWHRRKLLKLSPTHIVLVFRRGLTPP